MGGKNFFFKKLNLIVLIFSLAFSYFGYLTPKTAFAATPELPQTPNLDMPAVDGIIYDSVVYQDTVYLGGSFNYIGKNVGFGLPFSTSTKRPLNFPMVNGTVHQVIPDGNGGWFIAGDFNRVGNIDLVNLAHILPSGTVDEYWDPNPDDAVLAMALDSANGILYIGGSFTEVCGRSRRYLAALGAAEGKVLDWNPTPNASVRSLILHKDNVYVGGEFTEINGENRNYIAAIKMSDGSLNSWDPKADTIVHALAIDSAKQIIYVGGEFTQIGGESRNYLAAVNAGDGTVTDWDPNPNSFVLGIVFDNLNGLTYVRGDFTQIGGKSRNYLAAVRTDDGTVTDWNPSPNNAVNTMALDLTNGILYIGGNFTRVVITDIDYFAGIRTSDGSLISWDPRLNSYVQALALNSSGALYVGGDFWLIDCLKRRNLAAYNLNTGEVLEDWAADTDNFVSSLALDSTSGTLYVGGDFTTIRTQTRDYLAAINSANGQVISWVPSVPYPVRALQLDSNSSTIYVGGGKWTFRIPPRKYGFVQGYNTLTGEAKWSITPHLDDIVQTLALDSANGVLYAGGWFTGQLKAIDTTTGAQSDFANPNGNVLDLVLDSTNGLLYVGGDFTQIGGRSRNYLAAVRTSDGTATDWNPNPDSFIYKFDLDSTNDLLYVGGDFTQIGGQSRNYLAAVRTSDGTATDWNPNPDGVVGNSVNYNSARKVLLVSGDFSMIGDNQLFYFAQFGPQPGVNLSTTNLNVGEGGASQSYNISLNSKPKNNVTIAINSGSQLNVSPSTVIFTSSNWWANQTILVSAVDDSNIEGSHNGTIIHQATSSDTDYHNIDIPNINVNISDNDFVSGGGLPISAYNPPIPPEGGFKVLINDDAEKTDSPIVVLKLFGGPDTERMAISNNQELQGIGQTGQIPYQENFGWNLCEGRDSCSSGTYTVYVKFYTKWGQSSEIVFDSINYQKEEVTEEEVTEEPQEKLEEKTEEKFEEEKIEVCLPYLTKYIKFGATNDPREVTKLQKFLRDYEGFSDLEETGFYDKKTFDAVVKFQEKYTQEILAPWGLTKGTGFVYTKTIEKINKLYCQKEKPGAILCPVFTKSYRLGMIDIGINLVQKFLKIFKFLPQSHIVNNVFDTQVFEAVKAYQQKYNNEILKPLGLSSPTGFWGPASREQANLLVGCK